MQQINNELQCGVALIWLRECEHALAQPLMTADDYSELDRWTRSRLLAFQLDHRRNLVKRIQMLRERISEYEKRRSHQSIIKTLDNYRVEEQHNQVK